ncbi:right-handed parallel beta-helix repeat-containing protein [Flavivirga eckloniae]|uniref:Beta-1,3(4)-glucanase n=1 Tax=Flavivirga eckloniae TaxID=1803846 RepID=A0A2K9PU37_9FLAO|nr:T9SS type A sorting domain-containing protein [Flavivirga eckloniae]AUP80573.1 beta-1,3(4)-glucanase precursor [Flavivirga eckloniae]
MKKLIIIPVLLMFFNALAKDIYVAKNGDDDLNTGDIDSPYLTITKAASVAVAGDIVYIREGTYEETLTPINSGTAGNPIIYQSYPGERVIISAMENVNNFTQDSGSIYKSTLDWNSGQRMFVMHEGTVLDLARWPNNVDGDRFTIDSRRSTGGSDGSSTASGHLSNSEIPNYAWEDGGTLWFYGDRPGSGWTSWKFPITASSPGRVDWQSTHGTNAGWIVQFHPPGDGGDFYLEGVKEALDFQNEWYFNPTTRELFVQLPSGSAPSDNSILVSRRESTININRKNYIEIRNLAVFGGTIHLNGNSNRLYQVSSFYGGMTRGSAAEGISTGVGAIEINWSNPRFDSNIIEKCEIAFNDGSSIIDQGRNTLIQNNYIHDSGYLGNYDGPIRSRDASDSKILNNTITRSGRDGMNVINNNSEIAFNDVSFSNLIADDCGLFYYSGSSNAASAAANPKNISIHHNWFHDAQGRGDLKKAAGIYLDTNPNGFEVYNNVVWNVEWTAVQMNWNALDINIYNNTFIQATGGAMGAWHLSGTAFSNVNVWNNITDSERTDNPNTQETETTWEPQSDQQNNLIIDSSVFNNAAGGDFTLKAGSSPIDAGRVIAGITDGFQGTNPDAGAYEFGGDNWVAGIDWDPQYGPSGLGCYGLPGENCVLLPENDQDNDGVADEHDQCADTPQGSTVNAVGCPVFTLAADNFSVLATGENCGSSNNGSVTITSKETSYTFTAKIEGTSNEKTFTSNVVFDNMEGGDYTICITTTADADYEQCFDVKIDEPEALSVLTKVDKLKASVSLDLQGGQLYRINLNGALTITDKSQVTLQLSKGANNLEVTTNKDCQGQHKQNIFLFDRVTVAPTVVDNQFTIAFPDSDEQIVTYQVISSTGQVVLQKSVNRDTQNLVVGVQGLTAGLYFVNVVAPNVNSQSKIIKK